MRTLPERMIKVLAACAALLSEGVWGHVQVPIAVPEAVCVRLLGGSQVSTGARPFKESDWRPH